LVFFPSSATTKWGGAWGCRMPQRGSFPQPGGGVRLLLGPVGPAGPPLKRSLVRGGGCCVAGCLELNPNGHSNTREPPLPSPAGFLATIMCSHYCSNPPKTRKIMSRDIKPRLNPKPPQLWGPRLAARTLSPSAFHSFIYSRRLTPSRPLSAPVSAPALKSEFDGGPIGP